MVQTVRAKLDVHEDFDKIEQSIRLAQARVTYQEQPTIAGLPLAGCLPMLMYITDDLKYEDRPHKTASVGRQLMVWMMQQCPSCKTLTSSSCLLANYFPSSIKGTTQECIQILNRTSCLGMSVCEQSYS